MARLPSRVTLLILKEMRSFFPFLPSKTAREKMLRPSPACLTGTTAEGDAGEGRQHQPTSRGGGRSLTRHLLLGLPHCRREGEAPSRSKEPRAAEIPEVNKLLPLATESASTIEAAAVGRCRTEAHGAIELERQPVRGSAGPGMRPSKGVRE